MRVLWYPTAARKFGLNVIETMGWQERGTDGGAFSTYSPRVFVGHHTASLSKTNAPSLGIVTNGRPDLSGPLANVLTARNNDIYMIASGRANNAGVGQWTVNGVTYDSNYDTFGDEHENTGYGTGVNAEPWRDDQIETEALVAAAFIWGMKEYEGVTLDAHCVCLHKEWALPKGRKLDKHTIDGAFIRIKTQEKLNEILGVSGDMAWEDDKDLVIGYLKTIQGYLENIQNTAISMQRGNYFPDGDLTWLDQKLGGALAAALSKLPAVAGDLSADEVKEIVKQGVKEEFSEAFGG